MKYPRSWQVVRSADQPKDRCHHALPDHHRRSVHVDVCVCAGGCACSKVFVDATFFAFGRPPLTCRSPQCTGAARTRRPGFAAGASTLLTVPRAHHSGCDFRRAADTFNVETQRRAAQGSWCGSWTVRTDSLECRPSRARSCHALPCAARIRVPE